MSNQAFIIRTKFIDLVDGEDSYGFRIFDNYDSVYHNMWVSANYIPQNNQDLIKYCLDNDIGTEIIEFSIEEHGGIDIDGKWEEYKIEST